MNANSQNHSAQYAQLDVAYGEYEMEGPVNCVEPEQVYEAPTMHLPNVHSPVMQIPTKAQVSPISLNIPKFITQSQTVSPTNNILPTISNNIKQMVPPNLSPKQYKKYLKELKKHNSYWERNKTAIIWFIVIIVVIIIIVAIVAATDHKKCSKWFKSKQGKW